MENVAFKKSLPFIAVMVTLWVGSMVYNFVFNHIPSTDVTVRVVLSGSDIDITHLAHIEAYETYLPEPGERVERFQRYGPIFPTDNRPNVFFVENNVAAAFEATIGATTLGPIGTTGGRVEEYNITFPTLLSLVRLTVLTDDDPEFFVQAGSNRSSSHYESQSQGVPEDGELLFLLPEGEWTFTALDDQLDQVLTLTLPRGEVIEATFDLRSEN